MFKMTPREVEAMRRLIKDLCANYYVRLSQRLK